MVSPYIKSFSPVYSCDTATVTITGYDFAGATSVTIGGIPVISYTVNSDTSITALVPAGVSGKIGINASAGGFANSAIYSSNFVSNYFAYIPGSSVYPTGPAINVINRSLDTVVNSISVGQDPYGVCVSPDGSTVYVTLDNNVDAINTTTNRVDTIAIGSGGYPGGICVSPDGSKLYAAFNTSNTVYVINTSTYSIVATITVGITPEGICISPDGSKVYVTNREDSSVSIINALSNSVENTISVKRYPEGVCITPDGSKVYVANNGNSSVSVINTTSNTVSATIPVGSSPWGICMSPDGSKVYVANTSGSVSVINTTSDNVESTISLGAGTPFGISITSDGSEVFVTKANSIRVYIINTVTNTVSDSISVSGGSYAFGNFIIKVHCGVIRWGGNVSNSWENPSNWEQGIVPSAGSDVYIDAGKPRYPIVHSMASCRSLHQAAGTTVNVATGYRLKILGP
jgi:YVTN family beta-propeller protein